MNIKTRTWEAELNPFPYYAEMRHDRPVYFDPERHNWNVFRYADVLDLLSNWQVFSSQFTNLSAVKDEDALQVPLSASIISTDPPRHRQLRSLVTQAFTPKAVEALRPRIEQIVAEHLDAVLSTGRMDVIHDLAYPLPVIVIAEMLGVPPEDRSRFKHWSDTVVRLADFGGNIDPKQFQDPAIMEMGMYFMSMVQERQQNPKDDLISGLLAAEIDGQKLDLIELLGFCTLLLVAGNETTTNLIGNAMLTFAEDPDAWQELRAEPELLESAMEEVLRYRSPAQSMFRIAREEVEIAGVQVPAGAPLVAWIGSANHDEDQFPDPERFDIRRKPNKHIAFGQGIHFCLGAPLARLEAKIALGAMLENFRDFRLAVEPEEIQRVPSMVIYGVKALPIFFTVR